LKISDTKHKKKKIARIKIRSYRINQTGCGLWIGVGPSQPINLKQFSSQKSAILPAITLFSVSKRAL